MEFLSGILKVGFVEKYGLSSDVFPRSLSNNKAVMKTNSDRFPITVENGKDIKGQTINDRLKECIKGLFLISIAY